jgi:hypothetical protein
MPLTAALESDAVQDLPHERAAIERPEQSTDGWTYLRTPYGLSLSIKTVRLQVIFL